MHCEGAFVKYRAVSADSHKDNVALKTTSVTKMAVFCATSLVNVALAVKCPKAKISERIFIQFSTLEGVEMVLMTDGTTDRTKAAIENTKLTHAISEPVTRLT